MLEKGGTTRGRNTPKRGSGPTCKVVAITDTCGVGKRGQ